MCVTFWRRTYKLFGICIKVKLGFSFFEILKTSVDRVLSCFMYLVELLETYSNFLYELFCLFNKYFRYCLFIFLVLLESYGTIAKQRDLDFWWYWFMTDPTINLEILFHWLTCSSIYSLFKRQPHKMVKHKFWVCLTILWGWHFKGYRALVHDTVQKKKFYCKNFFSKRFLSVLLTFTEEILGEN